MELVAIKQGSPEWDFMWNWLEQHPINKGLDEPKVADNQNEQWHYMGSYLHGDKLISEFRHRMHPTTNNIAKASVEHVEFDKENIQGSAKIK